MQASSNRFDSDCNTYHHYQSSQNILPNSTLKFLDLFSEVPSPHPENFTLTNPKKPKDSRLVYADRDVERVLTARVKSARYKQPIQQTHRHTSCYSVKKLGRFPLNEYENGQQTTASNRKSVDKTPKWDQFLFDLNKSETQKQSSLKGNKNMYKHMPNKLSNCFEDHKCSYFDNRCLGVNLKDEGEVILKLRNNLL